MRLINGRAVTLADAFWDAADRIVYRFDIVNNRLGDLSTEAVVQNSDGSKTMYLVRLKVSDSKRCRRHCSCRCALPTRVPTTG